jgi:hypothetical protein
MAFNETFSTTSGRTIYAQIWRRGDGQIWSVTGGSFEAYQDGHWTNYAVAMTEQGTSGVYLLTSPSGVGTLLVYDVLVFARAGGSPALSDAPAIGNGTIGPQADSISNVSPNVTITPLMAQIGGVSGQDVTITAYVNAALTNLQIVVLDQNGSPVNLAGKTGIVRVYDGEFPASGDATKFTISTGTFGGTFGNVFTIPSIAGTNHPVAANYRWTLWNQTDGDVRVMGGLYQIFDAGPNP